MIVARLTKTKPLPREQDHHDGRCRGAGRGLRRGDPGDSRY